MSEADPGAPISYLLLAEGTAVYAEGGVAVGRVKAVHADPDRDIFEGIVVRMRDSDRFVEADKVGALHERAVILRISAEQCGVLVAGGDTSAPDGGELSRRGLSDMGRQVWERIARKR